MILYDAKQPGPNPVTVRLFVHERQDLKLDAEIIDLQALEIAGPLIATPSIPEELCQHFASTTEE